MSDQCLRNHLIRFVQHDQTSSDTCYRCGRTVAPEVFYRFCSDCDNTFCLSCFPQVEPRCCEPVTCEDIDSDALVLIKRVRWNRKYNRGYCTRRCTGRHGSALHTYWEGRLASSLEQFPYFTPSNWYRLSLQVDHASLPDWGPNWHTLYHGTHPLNIHKIVENGFLVRKCQHGFPALYLSPSILYSSHPRYARVVVHNEAFFQFVLEVRVDVRKLQPVKKRETLSVGTAGTIDSQFPNNEDLEFLLEAENGKFLKPTQGVVVSGVMVRKMNVDPASLPSSWWWCKWRKLSELHYHFYNGMENSEATD